MRSKVTLVAQRKSDPSRSESRLRSVIGWAFGKGWLQVILRTVAFAAAFATAVVIGIEPQRRQISEELSSDFMQIDDIRSNWQPVFTGMARVANREGEAPGVEDVQAILPDIDQALTAMSSFDAPTRGIKRARRYYIDSLERLSGAVFSYSGITDDQSDEYRSLHNAMQAEANSFGFLLMKVDAFQGNRLRAIWGTLF